MLGVFATKKTPGYFYCPERRKELNNGGIPHRENTELHGHV
jgi:hypothetical protein